MILQLEASLQRNLALTPLNVRVEKFFYQATV